MFLVSNVLNFMKLILNIYDHSVMMRMKFHHGVTSYGGFIGL